MTALSENCVKNFETFLRQSMYSDDDFKKFKRILKEVGGIIAGGSVLSYCYGTEKPIFKTNDIDIYVNIENSSPLMEFIFGKKNTYKPYLKARFSTYDNSYLSRNKIKSIYEYFSYIGSVTNKRFKGELDIMTVRNCRTPQEVAQNFDLSCCQVWYDGTNMYANNPEDVKAKVATVGKEYTSSYLSGNIFLHTRAAKYITRGFKIKADIPEEFTITDEYKVPFMKFRNMPIDKINEVYTEDSTKRRLVGKILCRIINSGQNEDGYDSEEYDSPEKLLCFGKEKVDEATNNFKKNLAKTVAKGKNTNIILLNDWLYKHWL